MKKHNGRDYLDIAPKEQPPRKLSGKKTVSVITLKAGLSLTEGATGNRTPSIKV